MTYAAEQSIRLLSGSVSRSYLHLLSVIHLRHECFFIIGPLQQTPTSEAQNPYFFWEVLFVNIGKIRPIRKQKQRRVLALDELLIWCCSHQALICKFSSISTLFGWISIFQFRAFNSFSEQANAASRVLCLNSLFHAVRCGCLGFRCPLFDNNVGFSNCQLLYL